MAKDQWGRVAATYDLDHQYISGPDLVRTIQSELHRVVPGGRVVELGCGTGLYTRAYAAACSQVVAVDASSAMLEHAQRSLADFPNVTTRLADATATGLLAGSADTVVAVNLLHVVPDAHAVMTEVHRLLRPGGLAVLVDDTGEAMSMTNIITSMVRFLRRWGPIYTRGQQDLTQDGLEDLARDAGLQVAGGHRLTGQVMNAAFLLAMKPSLADELNHSSD